MLTREGKKSFDTDARGVFEFESVPVPKPLPRGRWLKLRLEKGD